MKHDPTTELPAGGRPLGGQVSLFFAAMFGLLAGYALSVGPVAKLYSKGMMSPRASQMAEAVYEPMASVVGHYPPAGRLYQWYCWEVWKIPQSDQPSTPSVAPR